ncbi:hypothetical protein H2200_010147 [Cladophialophora chaetospira]|uniref:GH16 domain-containing protein n=1 Tax=Cladophialophora chaetospira TaxID=386627 RepID=A0AA38X2B6_9EURO|nr:hypothetical protein H2200_010147 [Cladophialophora chaetospira]
MPVRAHLKQLWERKIASCFGGQTDHKGDEPTPAPAAPSHVSPNGTRPSKTSGAIITYPIFPMFFIFLFLIHFCAPHASAHAIGAGDVAFADQVPAPDPPAANVVSTRVTGARAAPAVKVKAATKNRARQDDDQDNGDGQGDENSPADDGQGDENSPEGGGQGDENGPEGSGPADENGPEGGDDGVVRRDDGSWVVPGVGRFKKRAVYTFEQATLPAGLTKSNYTLKCRTANRPQDGVPYNEIFKPKNVQLSNGFLNLIVPGGQKPTKEDNYAISCAEVTTVEQNILYASVRTTAIFSQEPGTCHGFFFYKNDTQETDIEYLTDPNSLSNFGPDQPIPIWYTNQATDPENAEKTSQNGAAPTDCTTNVHEYRIDWTSDYTTFYVDGKLQKKFKVNVPSIPGPWVWNNWANGDQGWSVGPPTGDNILQIKNITMYYNTAKGGSGASSSMQDAQG